MSSDRNVHVSLTTCNGKWEYDGREEFFAHACLATQHLSWLAPHVLPAPEVVVPEVVVPEATEATEAPEAPEAFEAPEAHEEAVAPPTSPPEPVTSPLTRSSLRTAPPTQAPTPVAQQPLPQFEFEAVNDANLLISLTQPVLSADDAWLKRTFLYVPGDRRKNLFRHFPNRLMVCENQEHVFIIFIPTWQPDDEHYFLICHSNTSDAVNFVFATNSSDFAFAKRTTAWHVFKDQLTDRPLIVTHLRERSGFAQSMSSEARTVFLKKYNCRLH